MRRLAASALAAALAASLSGRLDAQSHGGHVLHVQLPGDLPVDDALDEHASAPPSAPDAIRQAAGAANPWREHRAVDPANVAHPRNSWDAPVRELDRQTRSSVNTRLTYEEVFSPSIAPFKRTQAYDAIDELGRLTVRDPSMQPMPVGEPMPAHWAAQRRSTFVGEMQVELSSAWPTAIPGVAAEQRLISYTTSNRETVEFSRDSAGGLFVRGVVATVRLTWVLEAPDSAFEAPVLPDIPLSEVARRVPDALRPVVPSWLPPQAALVLERAHVDTARDTVADALAKLVQYFRSFQDADLPPGADGSNPYLELALGRVGACRHRAYAMMPTLQALGIPARYVNNEAHAWVEAYVPGVPGYWTRLDLGGWNVPLDAHQATPTEPFRSGNRDPFPRPAEYNNGYSVGADTAPNGAALADGGAPPGATGAVGDGGAGEPNASGGQPGAPTTASGTGGAGRGVGAPNGSASGAAGSASGTAPAHETGGDEGEGLGDDEVMGTVLTLGALRADEGSRAEAPSAYVRGTMLRVEGEAHDEHGVGVAGLPVEIVLRHNGAESHTLGTTVTRPDGHWEARVLLPGDLAAGDYVVRARTRGDAHHASASVE